MPSLRRLVWNKAYNQDHRRITRASLLAKAVCQSTSLLNENRFREQARSHTGFPEHLEIDNQHKSPGSGLARGGGVSVDIAAE
jgi:hypothetical protein